MSRLAASVFLIGATIAVTMAAAAMAGPQGPRGRVVRVERSPGGGVAPRLCEIRDGGGTCVGDEPRPGQTVAVFDDRRVVAEVQIVSATPFVAGCPGLWTVQVRTLQSSATTSGFGVIDPVLHPGRAQVLDRDRRPAGPSGQPGEDVWHAVDRDGDGTADILITRYSCDPAGQITGGSSMCIDIWSRADHRLVRTSQLNFSQCNL